MQSQYTQRKQAAMRTRKLIYETALQLIERFGYNSVSVEQICRECGVSKGAFYHHFSSKKDLLNQSRSSFDSAMQQEILDLDGPACDKILLYSHLMSRLAEQSGVEVGRERIKNYIEAKQPDPAEPFFGVEITECLLKVVRQGQLDNQIRTDMSPEMIVSSVISFAVGYLLTWYSQNGRFSLSENTVETGKCFLDMLLPQNTK